jgi:hypothetical protein
MSLYRLTLLTVVEAVALSKALNRMGQILGQNADLAMSNHNP